VRTFWKGSALVALAAAVSLTSAVAALGSARSTSATTVAVTAGKPSELRFALSKKTVPRGTVTFAVANKGSLRHDFKIAGKKTPTLAKGKSAKLTVTFKKAGAYQYLCTLPGHAAGGMKGTLTVK
jgi:uncharacterized cupredoxin-like copper-binding protein